MRRSRLVLGSIALAALCLPASAQTMVNGVVQTNVTGAPPPAPFVRAGDAFALPVTTTAQTYAIVQPAGTTSYRGVNTCAADIAIKSVTVTGTPTTQPVTYGGQTVPNVLMVTSQTENVTPMAGTTFLGRTVETLGSFPNPVAGPTRYVSIMALSDPGKPCLFLLGYGNGG